MPSPALPVTEISAAIAPSGLSYIELRSTFQFFNPAHLAALKTYLGIAGLGGGPILAADIADSTAAGRALLTAADLATQKILLDLQIADIAELQEALDSFSVTAAAIAALDFSSLPVADPGSGKLWLNGGVLQVGA